MGFGLRKQSAAEAKTPSPSRVTFFVDLSGSPMLKDHLGAVTPAVSIDGSPIGFIEQDDDPEPEEDTVFIYSKVADGALLLFLMDDEGTVSQIGGGNRILWKDDTPGNPFVGGDTVSPDFGDLVMVNLADPDTLTINLPAITAASAAKVVGYRNLVDKKVDAPGVISVVPDAADVVETFSAGQAVIPIESFAHVTLESDGVGRWNTPGLGGGSDLWQTA